MIKEFRIPGGTAVQMGKPANPASSTIIQELASSLAAIEGVKEAHLPMCYAAGLMKEPSLVLILGLDEGTNAANVVATIEQVVQRVMPSSRILNVWPFPEGHQMLKLARTAGCQLLLRESP